MPTTIAYRGGLRVGPVRCITEDAIKRFDRPVPLAILGQPKPQQGRFYLGQKDEPAQPLGISKEEAGYRDGNRIRGPKVYPHHRTFEEEIWKGKEATNQNRSITGWVKEETDFEFDLKISNLTSVELGALVWFLDLSPDHYHRFGLGKPLGFGSVRLEIVPELTHVADGDGWSRSLLTWHSTKPETCDLSAPKAKFESAIGEVNPKLLPALLQAASGLADLPVHYPRLRDQHAGSGEQFEWFVQNESGAKRSLPDLLGSAPWLLYL